MQIKGNFDLTWQASRQCEYPEKIAGKAANYVVVNGLLFKIAQHKESGKWTYS